MAGMFGLLPTKMTVVNDATGVMRLKRVKGRGGETEQGCFEFRDVFVTDYD